MGKKNFYKEGNGSELCTECPDNMITDSVGSTSLSDCKKKECEPGKEESNGNCVNCKKNFYKEGNGSELCTECPDNMVTDTVGSTSLSDCKTKECEPGKEESNG